MRTKNVFELMKEIERTERFNKELPTNKKVIFSSVVVFLMGSGLSAFAIINTEEFNVLVSGIFIIIANFLILFSIYTFMEYQVKKKYLFILRSIFKNETETSAESIKEEAEKGKEKLQ